MPRNFKDWWNSLMGDIPALDQFRAQDFINYAWRDIREARRWSFLTAESSLDFPDEITTGTASVSQFSDVVVGSTAARAVWDALNLNMPITDRQFRVGTGPLYQIIAYDRTGDIATYPWNLAGEAGALQLERTYKEPSVGAFATAIITQTILNPIDGTNIFIGAEVFTWVNIVVNPDDALIGGTVAESFQNMADSINAASAVCAAAIVGTSIVLTAVGRGVAGNSITLSTNDPAYATITAFHGGTAGTAYYIYKAYHSPPSADFLSFTSVKDIQNGRSLTLDATREYLDRRDPMRQSFGDPTRVAVHKVDASGEIKVELWPHLLSAKSLVCEYERAGTDFADTESLPGIIPESLLMERALCYACRWANDNRNRYDALKGINWAVNIKEHQDSYKEQLREIKILDEEGSPSDLSWAPDWRPRAGFGDTRAGQSHDDRWL